MNQPNPPTASLAKPELLMPGGSLEKMRVAYAYGADAVYAGVPFFSLRARENEFDDDDLRAGVNEARRLGKKLYLTANIFARNLKLKSYVENLTRWAHLKPDALIMSDPGLIAITRDLFPEIPIHLSVQANCMNWQAVKFWQSVGVTRIILSRELRIEEVKEIRDRVPDMELEAFVHGAVCIAYSGRCLLSHYMSYRDANQGVCDNSCRYGFNIYQSKPTKPMDDETDYYIQDRRDPENFYRIDEDEHGTHIMNAKDLCLVDHLKSLYDVGICSFKVEGRTKSVYYAAMIAKVYRRAIDDMMAGKPFDPALLQELEKLSNRGYFPGFMVGTQTHESVNYKPDPRWQQSAFVGITQGANPDGGMAFEAKGQMTRGQVIDVITPDGTFSATVLGLKNSKGEDCEKVHAGFGICEGHFSVPLPAQAILCRRTPSTANPDARMGKEVLL